MFVPLLLDAIRAYSADDFSSQQMATHFSAHTGLAVPTGTMDALLSRARKSGHIERVGGRFFVKRDQLSDCDLTEARALAEATEYQIADALIEFARSRGLVAPSGREDALAALIQFVDRNQLLLILDEANAIDLSGASDASNVADRETRTVARFILEHCLPDPGLSAALRTLVEGFVLQNTLLLRDFGTLKNNFETLTVFFDTTFLFALRGIRGQAEEQAARETVQILAALRAKLAVFESTLKEMRRILFVYESRLGTSAEKATLHPREETRYFLRNAYTPAMVREMSVGLEGWLVGLGVTPTAMPYHNPKYTLDEQRLAEFLRGPDDPEAPRVINDIDCIGAVLTLRAGRHPRSMDSARAVLATTAGKMVANSTRWFREQGEPGIPPTVHLAALTSIAWLKKPAAAADLKLHELVALCAAALRPSPTTWARFRNYLSTARANGSLSSDEEVAILASELTDGQLSELSDVSDDPDAATVAEVIDRVKAAYGDQSAQIRSEADAKVSALEQARSDDQARAARAEAELRAAQQAIEEKARELEHRLDQTIRAVRSRARWWADGLSWLVYVVVSAAIIYASWHGSDPQAGWQGWALRIGGVVIVVLGLAGTLFGTHLGEVRSKVADWLEAGIVRHLLER